MADSGAVITFRELNERSNQSAHLFRSLGLKRGDHIALLMENHPLFLIITWAAQRSGLYYTAISQQPTCSIEDECEGSDMLYSSGTTGKPKGIKPPLEDVPLGTPNTLYNLIHALYMTPDEEMRYLSPAPLYHAERYLQRVEEYQITHSQLVPTMFVRMLKLPDDVRNQYDVSSLRSIIHAAAPCPIPVKEQMIEWWGPIIHEYYAGTEGMGFTTNDSAEWNQHKGSVGKAILGEVKIVDEEGNPLPSGEIGTVYFANGAPFEYHNDPDKTRAATHQHGWTTLGDVGYLDAEGYLYLTDRKAYTIISGGVNIYPPGSGRCSRHSPKSDRCSGFWNPQ